MEFVVSHLGRYAWLYVRAAEKSLLSEIYQFYNSRTSAASYEELTLRKNKLLAKLPTLAKLIIISCDNKCIVLGAENGVFEDFMKFELGNVRELKPLHLNFLSWLQQLHMVDGVRE